jgi:hypothetical protein
MSKSKVVPTTGYSLTQTTYDEYVLYIFSLWYHWTIWKRTCMNCYCYGPLQLCLCCSIWVRSPVLSGVCIAQALVLCVVTCRSLFVLLPFFLWSLYCLFFFDCMNCYCYGPLQLCLCWVSNDRWPSVQYLLIIKYQGVRTDWSARN